MLIVGTGHRPEKLGGYSDEAIQKLEHFAYFILRELGPTRIISGMALGWDQALALAAVNLGIPFTAAIPCHNHECKWPLHSQTKYNLLLDKAADKVILAEAYSPQAMMQRNKWMVDQMSTTDLVVALWDGTSGGTSNCIAYAESSNVRILNVWEQWEIFKVMDPASF